MAAVVPPANWLQMVERIREVRKLYPAPVDNMGCEKANCTSDEEIDQRFQILVSLMISSQTRDQVTHAAVQKLKDAGLGNVPGILKAKEKDIEDLIYPAGFYRRKAIYIKKVAAILEEQYAGDIPKSVEDLCKLPGVGPKMAHLCMQSAWKILTGIGVDTHVHRISGRLGWTPKKGIKDPEDTRKYLESWMPREYWAEINHLLVGFGQTVCVPISPRCHVCLNADLCPSRGALQSKVLPRGQTARKALETDPAANEALAKANTVTLSLAGLFAAQADNGPALVKKEIPKDGPSSSKTSVIQEPQVESQLGDDRSQDQEESSSQARGGAKRNIDVAPDSSDLPKKRRSERISVKAETIEVVGDTRDL